MLPRSHCSTVSQLSRCYIGAAVLILPHLCRSSQAATFTPQYSRSSNAATFTQEHLCYRAHIIALFRSSHADSLVPPPSRSRIYAAPRNLPHFSVTEFMLLLSRCCIFAVAFTLQLAHHSIYAAALALALCRWTRATQSNAKDDACRLDGAREGRQAGVLARGCFFFGEAAVFEKGCFGPFLVGWQACFLRTYS